MRVLETIGVFLGFVRFGYILTLFGINAVPLALGLGGALGNIIYHTLLKERR
jgi:lipoprotein signal peptidase